MHRLATTLSITDDYGQTQHSSISVIVSRVG